jgi:tRNA-uridine 2-sulfurtransferase
VKCDTLNFMKIIVAMSGGVDSSVAAARLVDEGHDVTGVHLALKKDRKEHVEGTRGCCTINDANDARRVADALGIPFYVWDMSNEFQQDVFDDFVSEYAAGRTPNPCLRCNQFIKFHAVLNRALALGFDGIATGHYANVTTNPDGERVLLRSKNSQKDQSYVLSVMTREQLAYTWFPLGDADKTVIRAEAAARGLTRVSKKRDSTDVCFIPDGDTAGFLTKQLGVNIGVIVDEETGTQAGVHNGTHTVTVGQRRGVNIQSPDGVRRFVTKLDPASNTVYVGLPSRLEVSSLTTGGVTWLLPEPPVVDESFECEAQIRAHSAPVPAMVTPTISGQMVVQFHSPQSAVSAGQTVALYNEDRVIGSGTILVTM